MLGAGGNLVLNKFMSHFGRLKSEQTITIHWISAMMRGASVGTSNPNLRAIREGFLEEEVSMLRPVR